MSELCVLVPNMGTGSLLDASGVPRSGLDFITIAYLVLEEDIDEWRSCLDGISSSRDMIALYNRLYSHGRDHSRT